jgi:hypothetical protein
MGGFNMTEKDIWKWILESFSDETIAKVGTNLNFKIPGFRQINPQQKNFKLLKPQLIKAALQPKNIQKLRNFFASASEEDDELLKHRGKSIEELIDSVKEDLPPSILLSVLLTSPNEEDNQQALELFTKLKEDGNLDLLEVQLDDNEEKSIENETEQQLEPLKEELDTVLKKVTSIEKKLRRSEQKNEELRAKILAEQTLRDKEGKKSKDENKRLLREIQTLREERDEYKLNLEKVTLEKASLQKELEQTVLLIKTKDDEIARLNALVLKLRTDAEKAAETTVRDEEVEHADEPLRESRVKVAVVGNPKNARVQEYSKYELIIIEGSEIDEKLEDNSLSTVEQIWMLTYITPKRVQRKVKSLLMGKEIQEFESFEELENHMVKG